MDLRSKNLSDKGMMVGDLVGVEKKEFLRLNAETAGAKQWLFYHEWHRRPGEREAGTQKPRLRRGVSVGQNHKALRVRGLGPCWELAGRRPGEGLEDSSWEGSQGVLTPKGSGITSGRRGCYL